MVLSHTLSPFGKKREQLFLCASSVRQAKREEQCFKTECEFCPEKHPVLLAGLHIQAC